MGRGVDVRALGVLDREPQRVPDGAGPNLVVADESGGWDAGTTM
jgi:hypothetical protein